MSLDLDQASIDRLRKFHSDGLLYLVNTAILHPRGLALTIHVNDAGAPIGLSVIGDGNEPIYFEPDSLGNVVERYHAAEFLREAEWSGKMKKASPELPSPPPLVLP